MANFHTLKTGIIIGTAQSGECLTCLTKSCENRTASCNCSACEKESCENRSEPFTENDYGVPPMPTLPAPKEIPDYIEEPLSDGTISFKMPTIEDFLLPDRETEEDYELGRLPDGSLGYKMPEMKFPKKD
ncbi:hypothetical protein ES702_07437 [subsurface metagenome]